MAFIVKYVTCTSVKSKESTNTKMLQVLSDPPHPQKTDCGLCAQIIVILPRFSIHVFEQMVPSINLMLNL